MAKKKARKSTKTKKKTAKKGSASGSVQTQFMKDFVSTLLGKPDNWSWPTPGESQDNIIADFGIFTNTLLSAALTLTTPASGGTQSLSDRIAAFLTAQQWPVNTPIPKPWDQIQPTVRLIEISVIIDHVLEALNAYTNPGSRGGPGGGWPPHNP
ncbi:MAG TPA: hypothetical protein VMG11_05210 [Steroidobacteraceae bacterium]|nr:hypothetical protein [Steroidobacteraceae bacterium]